MTFIFFWAFPRGNKVHLLTAATKLWQQLARVQKYHSKIWIRGENYAMSDPLSWMAACQILFYTNSIYSFHQYIKCPSLTASLKWKLLAASFVELVFIFLSIFLLYLWCFARLFTYLSYHLLHHHSGSS